MTTGPSTQDEILASYREHVTRLTEQRDRARRWAVALEQELAEARRLLGHLVNLAQNGEHPFAGDTFARLGEDTETFLRHEAPELHDWTTTQMVADRLYEVGQ